MSIPPKQIGWSQESNLLWQVAKQLEYLTKVTGTTSDVTVINTTADPVPVSITNAKSYPYKLISTASTNSNNISSTTDTKLYLVSAIGLTSTVRYLKLYDTSVAPVVGVDIPLLTIPVPTNLQGAGIVIPFDTPINFGNGLGIAITSGSADNDAGIIGAGDVIVNLTYLN